MAYTRKGDPLRSSQEKDTQALYDALVDAGVDLAADSLTLADFQRHVPAIMERLTADLPGRLTLVAGEELEAILQDVRALNRDEERLAGFLRELNTRSASFVV